MVYITSQLFGSDTPYERSTFPCTIRHTWDSMTDTQHTAGLGKRKRRAEDDCDKKDIRSFPHPPSPPGKGLLKLHPLVSPSSIGTERASSLPAATATYVDAERRPVKQIRRLNPKLHKQPSHLMDFELHTTPTAPERNNYGTSNSLDLRPCHSCSSVPKRKQDLENYMDCRHCERRACFICARECMACSKAICNKCIVEVGEEGDSWCLECHQRQINS